MNLVITYKNRYKKLPNLELIIKTKIEVMVLKYKFSNYFKTNSKLYLVDRFKNKYKVIEKNNLTYIYDYKETNKNNYLKYFEMGINYLREEYYD